jgi:hypothetical protein
MSGAELAITDPEKAIGHPSVDAVVFVTPTDTHARLIEAAANAGSVKSQLRWREKRPVKLSEIQA